jgi:hypothetical protein
VGKDNEKGEKQREGKQKEGREKDKEMSEEGQR